MRLRARARRQAEECRRHSVWSWAATASASAVGERPRHALGGKGLGVLVDGQVLIDQRLAGLPRDLGRDVSEGEGGATELVDAAVALRPVGTACMALPGQDHRRGGSEVGPGGPGHLAHGYVDWATKRSGPDAWLAVCPRP